MIRLVDPADREALALRLQGSPLGVRMASAMLAYAEAPFLDVWEQIDGRAVTSILCRLDGAVTAADIASPDREERAAFLQAVGFDSVTAACLSGQPLSRVPAENGPMLHFDEGRRPVLPDGPLTLQWNPSPRTVYPILEACRGPGMDVPPFDGWYVDLSHRMRRGLARSVVALQNGHFVGCALSLESPGAALLTGVAVLPHAQKKGLGRCLCAAMLQALAGGGKEVFVLCEPHLLSFYQSLGFLETGRWGRWNALL